MDGWLNIWFFFISSFVESFKLDKRGLLLGCLRLDAVEVFFELVDVSYWILVYEY